MLTHASANTHARIRTPVSIHALAFTGTQRYGTYYLDNPNASIGGNYVGPSPKPNCGNWCIQGPVVDFRVSTDKGKTWKEERLNATSGSDNLFGETAGTWRQGCEAALSASLTKQYTC